MTATEHRAAEESPEKTAIFSGYTTDLPNERSVYLAKQTDPEDDSYRIHFTNKGVETKLQVSGEALQTLVQMYLSLLRHQNAPASTWTVRLKVEEILPNE